MSDGLDELYQVSQAVLSVTRQMSVRDVLQVIVRSARSLVGARYAALGVPDDGDSFAEFVVDGMSSAQWQAIGPLPRRHGMLAVLLNEGQPERLAHIRADPRLEGWPRPTWKPPGWLSHCAGTRGWRGPRTGPGSRSRPLNCPRSAPGRRRHYTG